MRFATAACILGLMALPASLAGCLQAAGPGQPDAVPGPGGACVTDLTAHRTHAQPDRSLESIRFRINGSGTFRIDVPLPVSPSGTRMQDWLANVTRSGEATATQVDTERGPALRLEGRAPAQVASCSIQPPREGNLCCAESYLDAAWTTSGTRPQALSVSSSGTFHLDVAYGASSAYCFRRASFTGAVVAGWSSVPGQDSATCE